MTKKINMNRVAQVIAKMEGKKTEVNIAQIKEVLRCLKDVCIERTALLVVIEYLITRKE